MIDTHSHIYSEEFDDDIDLVVQRAKDAGVEHVILPNVDAGSLQRMHLLESRFPGYCHAAIGLHPTSVDENYIEELSVVETELKRRRYIAIGEIGLDLYWDKTHLDKQIICFRQQLEWALQYDLPVIIHIRDAFDETVQAMLPYRGKGLRGVFHSFTGTKDQALKLLTFDNFFLGINGIVTFKNSGLAEVVAQLNVEKLLLETDAPYLTPAPFRGKRNESSYVKLVCEKMADIFGKTVRDIEKITSESACRLFNI